jgi:hypothetical protein
MRSQIKLIAALSVSVLLATGCANKSWSGAPTESSEFHFRNKAFLSAPTPTMVKRTAFRDSPFFNTPSVSEYTDPADAMQIGDVRLDTISYVYFNDRLFRIVVDFQNDRLCSSAGRIVPTVESQYKLHMTTDTDPTRPTWFFAKAEPGNLRVVSLCWQDRDEWVSQLSFDDMLVYRAAQSAEDRVNQVKEQQRIQKEKQGF